MVDMVDVVEGGVGTKLCYSTLARQFSAGRSRTGQNVFKRAAH